MRKKFGFLLMMAGVEAAETIAEAWGEEADPKNCYELIESVGSRVSGTR